MNQEKILYEDEYGIVINAIRKNDSKSVLKDRRKQPVREEVQTVKQPEIVRKSLIKAWKKYGKE